MKPVPVAPPLPDETQLDMAPIKIAASSKPKADFIRIHTPLEKVSMCQDFTVSADAALNQGTLAPAPET